MPKLTVGLTGGIGSGKSEVLNAFARAGAATLSLDEIAHRLSRKGGALHRVIRKVLGVSVLALDGTIDRAAVARRVFARRGLRRRLEAAAHPAILRAMRRHLRAVKRPVAVVDVPLLFETGLQGDFDLTIVVAAGRELRIGRVARRDGLSRGAVLRRMSAQLPSRKREALADVVLRNEGNLSRLRRGVAQYQRAFELIARAGGRNWTACRKRGKS